MTRKERNQDRQVTHGSAPRGIAPADGRARRCTRTSAEASSGRRRRRVRRGSGSILATTSIACGGGPKGAAIEKVAAHALQWGMPILESSITLIVGDRLYYRTRRRRAGAVVGRRGRVADLDGAIRRRIRPGGLGRGAPRIDATRCPPLPFIAHAQSMLAIAAARGPVAFTSTRGVALTGWRIADLLTRAASDAPPAVTIDERLRAWASSAVARGSARRAHPVRRSRVECLRVHGARVTSSGSNPYAVVIAGLAALEERSTEG
jgi:hypothetical protein